MHFGCYTSQNWLNKCRCPIACGSVTCQTKPLANMYRLSASNNRNLLAHLFVRYTIAQGAHAFEAMQMCHLPVLPTKNPLCPALRQLVPLTDRPLWGAVVIPYILGCCCTSYPLNLRFVATLLRPCLHATAIELFLQATHSAEHLSILQKGKAIVTGNSDNCLALDS